MRALLCCFALMGCSNASEHPPMLGDCVRCAVIPGYGGSITPSMPSTDAGAPTQNEAGTLVDASIDGPTDGPLFDTGGTVFDATF